MSNLISLEMLAWRNSMKTERIKNIDKIKIGGAIATIIIATGISVLYGAATSKEEESSVRETVVTTTASREEAKSSVVTYRANVANTTSSQEETKKKLEKSELIKTTVTTAVTTTSTTTVEENSWNGPVLTPQSGRIQGPSGEETYYNLDMSGCISIMQQNGYDSTYWIRSDGVKMYGDYVMVAANLNIRPKGTVVETSLGKAIVVDTGTFAYSNPYQLDIAVTW